MASRKKIDDILLRVGASKVSQREWNFLKELNTPDLGAISIGKTLLEHRAPFENTRESIKILNLLIE
ncbi:hypothetical protein [Aliivibrio fischeri]|uniref:hypothetical protein n=1 Tax=Aliivibrio fischeri TaxID=668 RepID=UPI00084CD002|nr:hypothetical protein [Aliivibrio fischeri]OED53573.1 hypothetical protein BEI47_17765 [Aliivibrio fischeri]